MDHIAFTDFSHASDLVKINSKRMAISGQWAGACLSLRFTIPVYSATVNTDFRYLGA